jgi:hypothetical protein
MVTKQKLDPFFIGEMYKSISQIGDRFGEYRSFKEKYMEFICKKDVDFEKLYDFLCKYFTRVQIDWIVYLINLTQKNNSVELFSKLCNDLRDYKKELETSNIEMPKLVNLRNEIEKIETQIIEKNRKTNVRTRLFRKELIYGFVIGIITSIIGGIILSKIGLI